MSILLSNNASSLLVAPILAADTSLTVVTADAALFPQPTGSDYFLVTLEDRRVVPNLREIVTCTARSAGTLTITRAQEGTAASNFFTGSVVSLRLTAGAIFAVRAEEAALRAAADAAEIVARDAAILVETLRAEAAEAAEVAARVAAIVAEQTTRAAADTAEATARAASDATLLALRNTDISNLNAAIANNAANIAAETAARIAADAAEVTARNAAIAAAVLVEKNRALAAEALLAAAAPPGYPNLYSYTYGYFWTQGSTTGYVAGSTVPASVFTGTRSYDAAPSSGPSVGTWMFMSIPSIEINFNPATDAPSGDYLVTALFQRVA